MTGCKGLCEPERHLDHKGTSSSYNKHHAKRNWYIAFNWCSNCNVLLSKKFNRCYCCGIPLRHKPRNHLYKERMNEKIKLQNKINKNKNKHLLEYNHMNKDMHIFVWY